MEGSAADDSGARRGSARPFSQRVELPVRVPRWLLPGLGLLVVLALCAVWQSALAPAVKGVLGLCLCLYTVAVWRNWLLRLPGAVRMQGDCCQLVWQDGSTAPAEFTGEQFIHEWLLLLQVRCGGRTHRLAFCYHPADAEAMRQFRARVQGMK